MKIYLDVLVITNAIITFMYLCGLCKITHSKVSRWRMTLASIFGGACALIVIVQSKSFVESLVVTIAKLVIILLTIIIAFKWKGIKKLVRYFLLYITLNLIFAGCSLLLWEITGSKIIYMKNYTVYFNVSLFSIIIATIAAYASISIYDLVTAYNCKKSQSYKVKYTIGSYEIVIPAIADSGNLLCDSFSGIPIVIMYCNELYDHFNLDHDSYDNLNGFRLVPCSTVNGESLLCVTAKGNVVVIDENEKVKEIRCYVGITRSGNNKSRAIFNPCLLI